MMRRVIINPDSVLAELERRLAPDWTFASGRILGSMCSTPHPVAVEAYRRTLETNIGDEGLVPALAELEREAVATVGAWWGCPQASGRIVTGGTEANLLALWTARAQARAEQVEVLVPQSAHYSFDKAASLMGLKLIKLPLNAQGQVELSAVQAAISPRSLALIGIAGTTALGAVDDLWALADLARQHRLYYHIDASFGGFVLPFLAEAGYPAPEFGWPEGLCSLAMDPHKMGRGPIPSGMILWENASLAQTAAHNVQYLSGGRLRQNTLVGTRSGASVAAVWAVLKHLGRSGYVELVAQAMEQAVFFTQALTEMGGVAPMLPAPVVNVVGVRGLKRPAAALAQALREKGWALSLWDDFFRVVLMPHVTRPVLKEFLADLQEVLG